MRLTLVYFMIAITTVHSARILALLPHTGKSHHMVFEPLLIKLADRGHHLTVASFFPSKNAPANYSEISFEGLAPIGVETLDVNWFENSEFYFKIPIIGSILKHLTDIQPLAGLALNMCEKLVNWPPLDEILKKEYDVVFVENFNSDCMLGLLHVYGIKAPVIALLTGALPPWSPDRIGLADNPSYVPVSYSKFTSPMTLLEKMQNMFLNIYFKSWYHTEIQEKERTVIEKHYGKTVPLEQLSRNISLMLTNVYHPLNGVRPMIPGLIEVSGMHLNPSKGNIPYVWYRYAIQQKEEKLIENQYGVKIKLDELSQKSISLILVNTFHSLNGVTPLLPGLVEIGGVHLDPTRKELPAYMERFLNESEHGVVLFSFGSLIRTSTMPKYKEEILVNALSKLKQRVIWKYETCGEEGTLTGNILRVRWLPQYELLQHKKVVAFLAHGGLLGMTEAVSAGKPMVVVPFFGDQPANAAAAQSVGFAKVVPYNELTEESLTAALNNVLSAEMRVHARLVSEIWQDRQNSPMDTAVYWVERVIRWGPAAQLHSDSRDMPLYQLALLDVLAAYVVLISVIVTLLWYSISKISKLFIRQAKQKLQ